MLSSSPGIVQTVLTGNIARNARTKLEPFGLDVRLMLDVGAYGDDHVDRNVLVPFAWQRVRAATGVEHGADETWVIGDTPRDLACARAVGARCVLVATGHFDVDQLLPLGADLVMRDLRDADRFLSMLQVSERSSA